jgi:predicted phage gp36 major capsid-like protein
MRSRRIADEVEGLRAAHRRFLGEYRARLANVNRKIERFNWLVPVDRLRRQPVHAAREWEELLERLLRERGVAWGSGTAEAESGS